MLETINEAHGFGRVKKITILLIPSMTEIIHCFIQFFKLYL